MHLYKIYFASTDDAVYVWADSADHAVAQAAIAMRTMPEALVVRYLYSRRGEVARVIRSAA